MPGSEAESAKEALEHVLRESHLNHPEQLAALFVEASRRLGATGATIYLVDYEQIVLTALRPGSPAETLDVETSPAGAAFRATEIVESVVSGRRRMWLPLLDGLERLGAVEVAFADDAEVTGERRHVLAQLTHLMAELIVTNGMYTDAIEWVRRHKPMTLAAEMQHDLLPPLTFGTDQVIISGLLAPAYAVGGDSFDYALNGEIAHVAVFDAVGHGLLASQLAALAVACYRNSRRAGLDLASTALAIDGIIAEMFGAERFVTAVLGQLNVETGVFRYVNAGHPEPMLVRQGEVLKELSCEPLLPLGLNALTEGVSVETVTACEEVLEPGDRLLLVTDGVDEARSEDGTFFGRRRLAEFAARESATGLPTPEVMRRLHLAILRHQQGKLQDDATTLFVEWRTGRERELAPSENLLPAP